MGIKNLWISVGFGCQVCLHESKPFSAVVSLIDLNLNTKLNSFSFSFSCFSFAGEGRCSLYASQFIQTLKNLRKSIEFRLKHDHQSRDHSL